MQPEPVSGRNFDRVEDLLREMCEIRETRK